MATVNKAGQAKAFGDLPSDDVQAIVNARFGTDAFRALQLAWEKANTNLPGPEPKYGQMQQLRRGLPEELVGVEGKPDSTSCHYLGLCRDVPWGTANQAQRRAVVAALLKAGWDVERGAAAVNMRHLHYGYSKAQITAAGLLGMLNGTVALLRRLQQAGVPVAQR